MRQVSNKQIILLLRQAIKCVDRLLMDHGSRTAYILYKMLQEEGSYEMYEMADFSIFATFHDIGAYRTDELEDMLKFETKSYMKHSLYGYAMLKELSPMSDQAGILLFHHVNCDRFDDVQFAQKNIASYIFLADRLDIYYLAMGTSFDIHSLRQYEGTRYTKEALDLLEKVTRKTNILKALQDESYQEELDALLEYLVISNEDEEKYIDLMYYCMGFRNDRFMMETIKCRKICDEIAQKMFLTNEQREKLKYASLIHDFGMLMLPQELLQQPRGLSESETEQVSDHVEMAEEPLKKILSEEIVTIAMAHHERGNGMGYPRHLKVQDMDLLQRILQVADTVTALSSERTYRSARNQEEIYRILQDGVKNRSFSGEVVNAFLDSYVRIMRKANMEMDRILKKREAIETIYKKTSDKYI
ncbi:MAG: HD domain-containing protein [Lachnospiraceae bacterium]|nr:HD domain-containing protein [Lachnospiraceae bacterium]